MAHLKKQGFERQVGEFENLVWEEKVLVCRHFLELVVLSFDEFFILSGIELADVSEKILVDTLVPGTRLDTSNFSATKGLNFGLILSFSLYLIFHYLSCDVFFKS